MRQQISSLQFLKSLTGSQWKFFRTLSGKPYGGTVQGLVEFSPENTTSAFSQHLITSSSSSTSSSANTSTTCLKYFEQGKFRIAAADAEKLKLPANELEVSQTYFYCASCENGDNSQEQEQGQEPLKVFFSDGRQFLDLKFSNNNKDDESTSSVSLLSACDTHLCGQDTYKARFEILGTSSDDNDQTKKNDDDNDDGILSNKAIINKFMIEYNVSGPHKDYVSKTTYERV